MKVVGLASTATAPRGRLCVLLDPSHWCHVMERESYSNPAIAELLNRWFVSIKVDREERPDIDNEYMSFVEATTGSGGWPMNVFLTPDLKPFFGGTYFPPDDRRGQTGLRTLLPRIADVWSKQREEILRSADSIIQKLQQAVSSGRSEEHTSELQSPDHL